MKKYIFILLTLLTQCFSAQTPDELPFSTIHFVRTHKTRYARCSCFITLSNQREFNLGDKSIINYKIYSEGEILITYNLFYGGISIASKQVSIDAKRGKDYYVLNNGESFDIREKASIEEDLTEITNIQKNQESLDFPINRASIKDVAKKDEKGQGTCFLISEEGYLITNFHCVENAKEITVKGIDNDFTTKYGATLVATDPSNDLALIKVSNKNLKFSSPPFSIRSSGISQAEKIYALGFPKAEAMGVELKVTEGIISSKSGAQNDVGKFQISAAVNPGNSGGPLIDENGNLIGVIYAKSNIAESAGYAIKSSYLEAFLKNIDGFTYPNLINSIKEKPLTEKIAALKNFVYIIETN